MDFLGHRGARRSPRTHEPLNASMLSASIAVAVSALFLYDYRYILAAIISSGTCYLTHLLLDLFSGGIYIREGDHYRRISFTRQSRSTYNHLNTLVFSISVLLMALFLA